MTNFGQRPSHSIVLARATGTYTGQYAQLSAVPEIWQQTLFDFFLLSLAASHHGHRGCDHRRSHVGADAACNTTFPVSTICHMVHSKQHSNCTAVDMATAPMMKHACAVSITTQQCPRVDIGTSIARARLLLVVAS